MFYSHPGDGESQRQTDSHLPSPEGGMEGWRRRKRRDRAD